MVGVIIGCKKIGLNPDNVATPLAASFGDLITLSLLACFSQWFYSFMGERNVDTVFWLVTDKTELKILYRCPNVRNLHSNMIDVITNEKDNFF